MSAINDYRAKVDELNEYVRKNTGLTVMIVTENYPITISFFREREQVSLFDEGIDDSTPGMQFIFNEKMLIRTQENFGISEEIFNKLKSLSKEINRLYLHAFRERMDSPHICDGLDISQSLKSIGEWNKDHKGDEFCLGVLSLSEIKKCVKDHFDKLKSIR